MKGYKPNHVAALQTAFTIHRIEDIKARAAGCDRGMQTVHDFAPYPSKMLCYNLKLLLQPLAVHVTEKGAHLSTTTLADLRAAWVGILWGSSAWMFLPVGSTAGFLMGSPPGPGSTYLPSKACHRAQHSMTQTSSLANFKPAACHHAKMAAWGKA